MFRKIGEKKMDEKQEKAIALIQEAERLEVRYDWLKHISLDFFMENRIP